MHSFYYKNYALTKSNRIKSFVSIQIECALVKWKIYTGEFGINSTFDSITKRVYTHKVENRYRKNLAGISKVL